MLRCCARIYLPLAAAVLAASATGVFADDPALTIYNQNFAVVRDTVSLDLKSGANRVSYNDTTAHLEPDSVILRDPTGRRILRVLEQNYRADPISQELLLSLYEGKTIPFLVGPDGKKVLGKIIRSGYVMHQSGVARYGSAYYAGQSGLAYGAAGQPIIEMEGSLRFGLPGTPLFPALTDDSILKPTIDWTLETDQTGRVNAELTYVSGGMSWEADYNVVAPETGDTLDLVGWVTMDNQSGKSFPNAQIKLMAGDVSKLQPQGGFGGGGYPDGTYGARAVTAPAVTERTFDEYHLYTLPRRTTLRDRETKQVEFVRATGIRSSRVYVYNGTRIDRSRYNGYSYENIRNQREYGAESNPKIWVMREFANTEANKLGIPLPKGRIRFYRQGSLDDAPRGRASGAETSGGALEFTGENLLDHTPRGETVRIYTGDAFDLIGQRRQTDFKSNYNTRVLDESFEITLRNRKSEPVEIRVVETLYRGLNGEITQKSDPFTKKDFQTVEFRVTLKPDEERKITYTVHYTW